MASVPKLNYNLLPSFVYVIICKNKDGKGSSTRNRVVPITILRSFQKLFESATRIVQQDLTLI